jgi:hypothetical protein
LRLAVPESRRASAWVAFAAALCGALYLFGGPVWDDAALIQRDLIQRSFGELVALWTSPLREQGPGAGYFRPLALTVMAIVGRLGIPALHGLALLFHAVSAGLLVRLLTVMGARGAGVWLGGLLFAVHPMVSEVLGWASALPDAMAVTFALMAVQFRRTRWFAVFLLMGLLCKETAVLIPLAFGLAGMGRKRWWLGLALVVVFLMAWRGAIGVAAPSLSLEKLHMIPVALGWSLGSLVWPFPLNAVRDLLAAPMMVVWVGLVVVLGGAVWAGRDRRAWAGLFLLVAAPALALPTILDGYLVGERYLYMGLVGASLWLSSRIRWSAPPWIGVIVVGCALGVHGARATDWRNDEALFASATVANERSSYAWHFYGMSLRAMGRWEDAAHAFGLAVETGHPHPHDLSLQIEALLNGGDPEGAFDVAESGPRDGLGAAQLAWWLRAAVAVKAWGRATELAGLLRTPKGYDGPPWVPSVVQELEEGLNLP